MVKELNADIVIVGGSTGGCAAALAASKMGKKVIMTEEMLWIGGQLTNQAVPPDEHPWIAQFGCTRSYREFRNGIMNFYRRNFPLTPEARKKVNFDPGNGGVSRICHEPKVALSVIQDLLAPYVHSGKLTILTKHKPIHAESTGDFIRSVRVQSLETSNEIILTAPYILDATECGDLLSLAGVEYVTGAESQSETGEEHALPGDADPLDMQAITYCFAMDYLEGENHTIDRPADYDFWKGYQADFWPGKQLGWVSPHYITHVPTTYSLFPSKGKKDRWIYRRIIDKGNFAPGVFDSDITLVNWPQNDYWLGPIFEVSEEERNKHLYQAKQLSLSLLYWLQTESPRPDGGEGYPGLRLRKDIVGTEDGLAMSPYIRESRRIKAEYTIVEQDISAKMRGDRGAKVFHDSVGIGCYRTDLHPSTGNRNYIDLSSWPFQIPLGSLLPVHMENLLPACKNIGTTHITNGSYRLHPVEWNIGEAVGYLASYCLEKKIPPRNVRSNQQHLNDYQKLLTQEGIELTWPKLRTV
ncbi:FAD-dependent oxidoreductase [Bacillus sp. SD088]|uniref:FAD-dependent oxidoreductase n=1 Tax=Bacillus sp. SD088 TaxID=2782012 RepID=UPI001A965F78|nr:FAD-dependent oxidoreductase [Bacillus sp. SD088]MBO0993200.1 FAD-dependent oxidoreductase [Bacillus sp. SD088]